MGTTTRRRSLRRACLLASVLSSAPVPALTPQEAGVPTPAVFRQFGDRVVRVQVVEVGTGTQVTVGSGFFADADGRVITNYHVVADLVHHPGRYRAELGDRGTTDRLTLLAVDVVHDLAVLRAPAPPTAHFRLRPAPVRQGDRLYALGHPRDLGLSIVEGTYNGLLEHTLYPKLHFTGSLNPGMSGGPAITAEGRVVGVNVSTAGNQLSFLVPVDRVVALLERAPYTNPLADRLLEDIGRQIRDYQDVYLQDLFSDSTPTVTMGSLLVPTEPAPFFRCWGEVPRETDQPFERTEHRCGTDDEIHIARNQQAGVVRMTHELLTTASLGPARFYALYTDTFGRDNTPYGREEHVTRWRCATRNVAPGTVPLRAVVCLRAYRKLRGLYDGVIKVAVLGRDDAGLVSTLVLSGASHPNIVLLTRRFLEQFRWR